MKLIKYITYRTALLFFLFYFNLPAQKVVVEVKNTRADKAFLYSLEGEKLTKIDSAKDFTGGRVSFQLNRNYPDGIYRIVFNDKKAIDFIYDGKDVELKTDDTNIIDSLKVIAPESSRLYYSFLKLNKQYKLKSELLSLILARYPKDDEYYTATKNKLNRLQNEYLNFVNTVSQKEPGSFTARYIRSARLPVADAEMPAEKQYDYLKARALDNVNFNDASLINSDLFTNKTIEYLTYYRNPRLSKESLEKEFMKAADTLLNKAKINRLVYRHITEYLVEGFRRFEFNEVIDYIVNNYVIKDDICLSSETEAMIKKRIDQARIFKTGAAVPELISEDTKGNRVKLSDIRTEKILIVFYSSLCPHCKELMPKLNERMKQKENKNITVLAVSLDTNREEWINFTNENCPSFVNVSDLKGWNGKAVNDYCVYATPSMFLIDKEKKIIARPLTLQDTRLN